MTFENALALHFAGAMPVQSYLSRMHSVLYRDGFTREHALVALSVCRDEIMAPLRRDVERLWGDAFELGGLAGLVMPGRSGVAAAIGHGPVHGGRVRLVCLGLAHVALATDGTIGPSPRPGRTDTPSACSALAFARAVVAGERQRPEEGQSDAEITSLLARLEPRLGPGERPDLLRMTHLAHAQIAADLADLLDHGADPDRVDFAVATGILVHGPSGRDHVWPGELYARVRGVRLTPSLA